MAAHDTPSGGNGNEPVGPSIRRQASLLLLPVLVVVLALWQSHPAAAQPSDSVGRVDVTVWQTLNGGTMTGLGGARVILGDYDGQVVGEYETDADGRLSFETAAGAYSLTVYKPGFVGFARKACDDPDWDTEGGRSRWGEVPSLVVTPVQVTPAAIACYAFAFDPVAPVQPPATPTDGIVYLTFDDGMLYLCETVQLLRSLDIRATFFLTGRAILAHPSCVRDLVAAGNRLANHTFAHEDLTRLSPDGIWATLQATEDAALAVAGVSTKPWCRPPGGAMTALVWEVAAAWGCTMLLWDRDTLDWSGVPATSIEATALSVSCNGEVILLHTQAYPRNRIAVSAIVTALRNRGCTFLPVSGG